MPVPAAAPRPNARTYAEGKLDFPPHPPAHRSGALKSAPRSHTSQERASEIAHFLDPPKLGVTSLSRRERTRSGNMRTEERQETVYALRQGGSTWAVRPWFVWLFADALKCRRWCYGATDGINSFSRLAALGPDSLNGR